MKSQAGGASNRSFLSVHLSCKFNYSLGDQQSSLKPVSEKHQNHAVLGACNHSCILYSFQNLWDVPPVAHVS